MSSEQTRSEARPFGNEGRRVVLLITTPVGESFQSIAQATGFRAPQSTPVDWSSHENSSLPDIASRLKFTTHYALCVTDREIWESASMSLLEKLRGARFWDHPGDFTVMAPSRSSRRNSSGIPVSLNACRIWSDEDIRSIDSGEVIGWTDMSNEEITRVYAELRRDWTYMPIFWNCHDLAIRLAYIVFGPSMDVIMALKRLMVSLRQACYKEINLNAAIGTVCVSGWSAAALGGLASVPPLAMAGIVVFTVGWSAGFFGQFALWEKQRARCQFMVKLEERFPELRSLHN